MKKFLLFAVTLLATACPAVAARGRSTVLWINLDGFRPSYINPQDTPHLARWAHQGAFTADAWPVVPSLGLPSRCSEATGVTPGKDGIPADSFYDTRLSKTISSPCKASYLQAQPIWRTAALQGLGVAVSGWPLSCGQTGHPASLHCWCPRQPGAGDHQRLWHLLRAWHRHPHLRLLMANCVATDRAGHLYGPDSFQVLEATRDTDALLGEFVTRARALWHQRRHAGDRLYLVITTDHGMAAVDTAVNPNLFPDLPPHTITVASGTVASFFLPHASQIPGLVKALSQYPFMSVYRRDDLPRKWGYANPSRVGDVVIFLKPGYAFNQNTNQLTTPVGQAGGPLGADGYNPAASPQMLAFLLVQRFPKSLGGLELGPVSSLQFHATVARLLGIRPAPGARQDAVNIPTPRTAVIRPWFARQ